MTTYADSIKAHERKRRGTSDTLIVKGLKTRRPKDFKTFLQNDENKKSLCRILKAVWESDVIADKLHDKKIILIVEGKGTLITSEDGVSTQVQDLPELKSTHDETDR